MKQGQIARLLDMTQAWLSQVEQTPIYREHLERRRKELVDDIIALPERERIAAILKAHGIPQESSDRSLQRLSDA